MYQGATHWLLFEETRILTMKGTPRMAESPALPSKNSLRDRFWRQLGLVLADAPPGLWLEVAEQSATLDPRRPPARCFPVQAPDGIRRRSLAQGTEVFATPDRDFDPGYVYEKDVLICHDAAARDTILERVPGAADDAARAWRPAGVYAMRLDGPAERGGSRVLDALRKLRDVESVSPNYLVSICNVNLCPADEPVVPEFTRPDPPQRPEPDLGAGKHVLVIDTGLVTGWDTADHLEAYPWLADKVEKDEVKGRLRAPELGDAPAIHPALDPRLDLDLGDIPVPGHGGLLAGREIWGDDRGQPRHGVIQEYVGHGTFIAGVVRCVAPRARVTVYNTLQWAGTIDAMSFGDKLIEDLARYDSQHGRWPDVISLSAGVRTVAERPLVSLGAFMDQLHAHPETTLVAAAGNDAMSTPFYPAAYAADDPSVVSVGALNKEENARVAFSDYGDWVKVYARGYHLVNAFAFGEYTTLHPADHFVGANQPEGTTSQFEGLARWSGTSFSTPLVAGLIVARMSVADEPSRDAAAWLLDQARKQAVTDTDGLVLPILRADQSLV